VARTFLSSLSLALALSATGIVAAPALAAAPSSGAYYQARFAAPPAAERLIVRRLIWKCGPGGCVAGRSNSLATTDCAALARQGGRLSSFTVAGRALSAAELEKCNARAR
jgi:hypothetical protein